MPPTSASCEWTEQAPDETGEAGGGAGKKESTPEGQGDKGSYRGQAEHRSLLFSPGPIT